MKVEYIIGAEDVKYIVGLDDILKIEPAVKNGEMAPITFYKVYFKNNYVVEIHTFAEVAYYLEEGEELYGL